MKYLIVQSMSATHLAWVMHPAACSWRGNGNSYSFLISLPVCGEDVLSCFSILQLFVGRSPLLQFRILAALISSDFFLPIDRRPTKFCSWFFCFLCFFLFLPFCLINKECCMSFTFPKFCANGISSVYLKRPNCKLHHLYLSPSLPSRPMFGAEQKIKCTKLGVGAGHQGSVQSIERYMSRKYDSSQECILIAALSHTITTAVSKRRHSYANGRTFTRGKKTLDKQIKIYYTTSLFQLFIHSLVQ